MKNSKAQYKSSHVFANEYLADQFCKFWNDFPVNQGGIVGRLETLVFLSQADAVALLNFNVRTVAFEAGASAMMSQSDTDSKIRVFSTPSNSKTAPNGVENTENIA